MRTFFIKPPLLLLFSLTALSCPCSRDQDPHCTTVLPFLIPAPPCPCKQEQEPTPIIDPPLIRVFLPRTEAFKADLPSSDTARTSDVDGIVQLY